MASSSSSSCPVLNFEHIFRMLPQDMKDYVKDIYWREYVETEARFHNLLKMTKIVYPFWCPDYNLFAFFADDIHSGMHVRVREIVDDVLNGMYRMKAVAESQDISNIIRAMDERFNYYEGIECRCMDFVDIDEIVTVIDYVQYPERNPGVHHYPFLRGFYDHYLDRIILIEQPLFY